uniref:Lipoyl-binding domain-containing protein n=1 Tax=Strongyloides papillosus TaxID=174720 RepID=A0A0N5C7H6_STREA
MTFTSEVPANENKKTVIMSPNTGIIENIKVKVGDVVNEGQELIVIQSMKMQSKLLAIKNGRIKNVNCKVGDNINIGEVLIELE